MKTKQELPIEEIKAMGFRVFQRKWSDNYAYFTDGKSIGNISFDSWDNLCCYTVHIPNQTTGTGYKVEISGVTKSELEKAFAFAPEWASQRDRNSINKYSSLDVFLNSPNQTWGGGLKEV